MPGLGLHLGGRRPAQTPGEELGAGAPVSAQALSEAQRPERSVHPSCPAPPAQWTPSFMAGAPPDHAHLGDVVQESKGLSVWNWASISRE